MSISKKEVTAESSAALLAVEALDKKFGEGFRLGPLSFSLAPGDTVAIFGENGSGKSTLFQLITGNLHASAGIIHIGDHEVRPESAHVKRLIGYLPQDAMLPRWTTAQELLEYACRVWEISNSTELVKNQLSYWDCFSFQHRPLGLCSYGMHKRIGLALATIHNPELVVLDEPFSGLDILHIRALEQKIESRTQNKKTTILSTHVSLYAARYCNRTFVLRGGSIREITEWKSLTIETRIEVIESIFASDEKRRAIE